MVIGLHHIGIAVNNLKEAMSLYCDVLGLKLKGVHVIGEQKVRVAVLLMNDGSKIELLEPTEGESPVAKFIEKRGEGIHHIALKVKDIEDALVKLRDKGLTLIDEKPRIGVEGARVAFIHPKSTRGALLELVTG